MSGCLPEHSRRAIETRFTSSRKEKILLRLLNTCANTYGHGSFVPSKRKSPRSLPVFGLELSTRSSPEPTRCKESLLGWECSWKGFALWLKEKEQGILLFMPTLHWDVMSGAVAATLDHGQSKTGRSWVLREIIVLTNWPLDSPASDSCCLRTKRLYCVSSSRPRILLLTATTS